MAKASKLKVFRTPIGFHDAYVAATSQKAALEAWGSDANLFARGSAEQVTDPRLMEAPLERPGEVIKVLRGTEAEQVAALGKAAATKLKTRKDSKPAKAKKKAKPSRASLAEAEEELKQLRAEQAKELAAIDEEMKAIERKRRDLERRQARELAEVEEKMGRERTRYEGEMERWRKHPET